MEQCKNAIDFIKEHRLWMGFWKFNWVFRLLVVAGLVAGWKLFTIFQHWFSAVDAGNPLEFTMNLGTLFTGVFSEGYNFFFLGGFKYIVLILVEIIVFHFVRRTQEILTGDLQDFTPKTFIRAEIRMIKIVARNFVIESILMFLVGTVLSMFGFSWMKAPFFLLIQAYFLGFAVLDNYFELYGMSIKQSAKLTAFYPGLSVAVGLVTYSLLLIPVLGAFLAPFLVGVAAPLAMHEVRQTEGGWRADWTQLGKSKRKEAVEY